MDATYQIFVQLFLGSVLGWLFRSVGQSSFIGYVIGGFIASLIMQQSFGSSFASQLDFLKSLGLMLFSFEMGLSIGIERLTKSLSRVIVVEMVVYSIIWFLTALLSIGTSLNTFERIFLFLVLIDCSSVAINLVSRIDDDDIRSLAIVQSNFEDLAQFMAFSMIFTAGITKPDLIAILTDVLKVIGLTGLLAYVLNLAMKRFYRWINNMDRLSKSILFLSIALLYSTLVQGLNLPTLFGAFIAGIVLSSYVRGDEISIMSGLRELGLLLYFSSIGMQMTAFTSASLLNVITYGFAYAVAGVLTRFISLSLGALFITIKTSAIPYYAASLSSISETSIVFADTLIQQGALNPAFKSITITTVIISMILSQILFSGASRFSTILTSLVPQNIKTFFTTLSHLLLESSETSIKLGSELIKFLIPSLLATYITYIASAIPMPTQNMHIGIAVATSIAAYIVIVINFYKTLNSIIKFLDLKFEHRIQNWNAVSLASNAITIVLVVISIILLFNVTNTMLSEDFAQSSFHGYLVALIHVITFVLLFYLIITRIRVKIQKSRN